MRIPLNYKLKTQFNETIHYLEDHQNDYNYHIIDDKKLGKVIEYHIRDIDDDSDDESIAFQSNISPHNSHTDRHTDKQKPSEERSVVSQHDLSDVVIRIEDIIPKDFNTQDNNDTTDFVVDARNSDSIAEHKTPSNLIENLVKELAENVTKHELISESDNDSDSDTIVADDRQSIEHKVCPLLSQSIGFAKELPVVGIKGSKAKNLMPMNDDIIGVEFITTKVEPMIAELEVTHKTSDNHSEDTMNDSSNTTQHPHLSVAADYELDLSFLDNYHMNAIPIEETAIPDVYRQIHDDWSETLTNIIYNSEKPILQYLLVFGCLYSSAVFIGL
jgi:hypothetical protein